MNRKVTHEIKLEKSVKLILLVFAIAIFANAFQFSNPIKDAWAEISSGATIRLIHTINSNGLTPFNIDLTGRIYTPNIWIKTEDLR